MVANILFWIGIVVGILMVLSSLSQKGNDKLGGVAFPFLMILAAAVAKYLGL